MAAAIEKLREEHAVVSGRYQDGLRKAQAIEQKLKKLTAEIAQTESKYEGECRRHAADDANADPAGLLADIDRKKHKLIGLQALLKEATEAYAPFWEELQRLSEKIVRVEEDTESERLQADRINRQKLLIDLDRQATEMRKAVQQAMALEHAHWRRTSNRRAAQAQ